ncbi:MAG: hypothetical protein ACI8PZ_000401 [Myxococcota bacterium]
MDFAVPERIHVKAGARVSALARRLHVDTDDLKSWNDLDAGRIPADMELVVWRPPDAPPFETVDTGEVPVAAAEIAPRRRRAQRAEGAPDAEETEAHLALLRALTDDALSGGSMADGLIGGASVTVDGHVPGTSLANRSGALSSLGRIESGPPIGPVRRSRDPDPTPGVHIPDAPVSTPSVRSPSAKRCLTASADVALAEDGMAEAKGLTVDQVQLGMLGAARRSLPCFPDGTRGEFVVTAEVVAGCDGRVMSLSLDRGPVPAPVTACLTTVLRAASFSAHARPGGVSFTYPLRYRF